MGPTMSTAVVAGNAVPDGAQPLSLSRRHDDGNILCRRHDDGNVQKKATGEVSIVLVLTIKKKVK